jgi:CBS domain containing-hemolysin-like protein
VLALSISFLSETIIRNLQLVVAFVILAIIISIGIFFDIIGIAVAASDSRPLNGMAAKRIPGAREAVELHKNAGVVSNFCNDVVGDICGIISGAAGAVIALKLIKEYPSVDSAVIGILFSSFIAAITVGGKAIGKSLAIERSSQITFSVGKVLNFIGVKTGIRLFGRYKKNSRKR